MATTKDETYFVLRKENGETYLCPLNSVKSRDTITEDELDICVEKDIVERYSGNIDIEQS
jgi:hypothetical protein